MSFLMISSCIWTKRCIGNQHNILMPKTSPSPTILKPTDGENTIVWGIVGAKTSQALTRILWQPEQVIQHAGKRLRIYMRSEGTIGTWISDWTRHTVFIASQVFTRKNRQVTWYKNGAEVACTLMSIHNAGDFLSCCVHKKITPESLG